MGGSACLFLDCTGPFNATGARAVCAGIKSAAYPLTELEKIRSEKSFEVSGAKDVRMALKQIFEQSAEKIKDKIVEKLHPDQDLMTTIIQAIKKLAKFWASTIAVVLTPFSGALDIAIGLAFTVDAASQKVQNWVARSYFRANGHTEAILDAIDMRFGCRWALGCGACSRGPARLRQTSLPGSEPLPNWWPLRSR